jgi:hypothetical protein
MLLLNAPGGGVPNLLGAVVFARRWGNPEQVRDSRAVPLLQSGFANRILQAPGGPERIAMRAGDAVYYLNERKRERRVTLTKPEENGAP